MLPPKIVLLIGNRGESVQAIQQSLSTQYQVVLFHEVEKEVSWFNPIAVIIHQNGAPAEEIQQRLFRLKQLKPKAPVLLCRSGQEATLRRECPDGINATLAWPGEWLRLCAQLQEWEQQPLSLTGRLRLAWQALARYFYRSAPEQAPLQLPAAPVAVPQESRGMEARLFGAFELRLDGQPLPPIRSEVNRAMLAYLLYQGPGRMLRQRIIEGFWPDSNEEAARNCLNVAISSLRRYWRTHSPQELEISFQDNAYQLQAPCSLHSDVREFLQLWKKGKSLERAKRLDEALNAYRQASRLYTGDFLECISRNIEWVESIRSKLKESYLSVLDRLSALLMDRGVYQEAEQACRKILDIDDCIESAHRQLMHLYYRTHRRGRALRQYAQCRQALHEKLGAEPFRETEELYHAIINGSL